MKKSIDHLAEVVHHHLLSSKSSQQLTKAEISVEITQIMKDGNHKSDLQKLLRMRGDQEIELPHKEHNRHLANAAGSSKRVEMQQRIAQSSEPN